ncbi:hypothetical protein F5876DRAFT_71409 [Lentinula aff. lateritia]|uniref:Uncharacterized protein n=1 Tax=Lentinula aff. lateritia TaxID=2804960 RepID=A0ACC1UGF3_9AGAR|nr:hypothetical protein F5876DRAFT_71409 [Lentinula aff. lateritia]
MDNNNNNDFPLDYKDGTEDGRTDELVNSQPLQDDNTYNNRSQTVPEGDFQISQDHNHKPSSITLTASLSDPAAPASQMLQLSGALRQRAQPGRMTTKCLLLVPYSRCSLASQLTDSFSFAGGISVAPSPSIRTLSLVQ